MVISPLSIIGCMYMLAAGSAGETREEILTALNFGNIFQNGTQMDITDPFRAYKEIVDDLSNQKDGGYTLKIGKQFFDDKNILKFL